jgi:hypothetical protein
VAAGEGDSDGSTANDLGGRWEGVRRSGCRMKQRWRCLTMDEVDGGFTGAALKTNTSAIDGDLRGEQRSSTAVSCSRRHRKRTWHDNLPRWVAAAPDHPGRNGHNFKGVRHPSQSTCGAPGGRCRLTGGLASVSAPLTSARA